jgi:tetratricopeptide (TPR) repeat protein
MNASVAPGIDRNEIPRDEFELVRTRVDNLEVKAAEAKKPWYRQLPLWISILSLLVSSGFSGYTAYEQRKEHQAEELKKRLESLRATLLQIADIRNEFLAAAVAEPNQVQLIQRSSQLNAKKQILIENADALISGIETEVSPALFIELAYEESTDGEYADAKQHYEQGLRGKGLDTISSLAILRSLGEIYMQPGTTFHDNEKGREEYRQALKLLQNNEDDSTLSGRTMVWSYWAYSEFVNGSAADGQRYLDEARTTALKINPQNTAGRQQALSYVAIASQYSGKAGQSPTAASSAAGPTFAGQWRISYQGEPGRTGLVTVAPGPDGKTTTVNVDIFENQNLVRKYSGPLYVQGDGAIQVEWSGVQSTASPAMPWMALYGSTILRVSKDGNMVGKESAVGDVTRVISLQKAGRS